MALSDKLNILFPMAVDDASLTVTPAAVATLPEANIFNSRRDKFMRVTGTSAVIKFNANASELISGLAIGNHNLANGDTVRIRVYSGFNQTGIVQHDSTAIALAIALSMGDLLPQTYYYPLDEVAFKSIQIDVLSLSNSQIDIGRIMPGFVFKPNWNYSEGSKWQWLDNGDENTVGSSYRTFTFDLKYLSDNENDRYEYEKMKAGKQGDLLVCLKPSSTGLALLKNTAICKRITDISRVRARQNINHHSEKFQEVYK
jgi:hypothetical protein